MRKIMSLCLMLMCQLALMGQARIGADPDYNPNNPGDPQTPITKYTLVTEVTPQHGGTTNHSSAQQYAEGTANISLRAYPNTGYRFVHWLQGDSVVSTSSSFIYTMPAKNVTLTAVFKYSPDSPSDPDSLGIYYTLTVEAQPQQGGSFNVSNTEVMEGHTTSLYAYTNTGYRFKGWKVGDSIVSTEYSYSYTMGGKDAHIIGMFEYSPSNPENPGKNSWNEATGEVIVDDFTPGNLSNAIYNALNKSNSSSDDVTMITVAGQMSSNDFGIANNYYNCTLLDLSRTYGYSDIPSYAYDWNSNLQHIILPVCVENIGYSAFNQCYNLSEVTCYAVVPPNIESYAFSGIAEGAVLHVLSSSISLYAEAEGWKDFTILPLTEEVRTLEVNLPAGSEDGRYKNMTLELVNAETGHKQKYVISDRVSYNFSGLLKKSLFNIYVRNSLGFVLGQIENIAIADEDVSVTFESLMQPQEVTLNVLTAEGENVTNQIQATWFDAAGTYLSRGNAIKGVTEGTALTVRMALPQTLGMTYIAPTDTVYVVQTSTNKLNVVLSPLPQVTISGTVKDVTTGSAISNAVVSVSQTLNGKYSKAFTAKTDNKGVYSMTVYGAPSAITYSSSDYISQTFNYEDFSASCQLGEVALKSITGATITTSFTYRTSVEEGATPDIQNWYSDYANVAYSIYNKTQQKPINDFSVQYPSIVLLEEVAEGDELVLTATSKNGAFVPVEAIAIIDASNRAEAIFDIVALGGIKASFFSTDNSAVVGILYNAGGQLVKKYNYSSATININDLQDGKYTLVSMGSSTLFNSIYNLSQLASTGLKEGTDYVQNTVTVESGLIATISNDLIPTLDESKLYYTGDNTMFSVNKTSVTAGNYLTLKGKIDFKNVYASKVSNVSMVIDLPESAEFVENSVMVGTGISSYTLDGNRLTIPLERYTDQVRFCIIPTTGGDYAPNAFAQFTIDGKEVLQPIGSAHYTIKDLSINVPSIVAKVTIPISGTALGNSTIQIYDNNVLIGETTSLANGVWSTTCELDEPYNLSTHNIYAKVTNKQGLEVLSGAKDVLYDMDAVQVSKVTMFHWNPEMRETYESTFDFTNPSSKSNQWTVYYPDKKFTYTVEFTNNSPEVVSNVVLYVHAADGQIVPLYPTYNESKDLWIAEIDMGNRSDGYYPVNVSVDFEYPNYSMCDSMTYVNSLTKGYSTFSLEGTEKGNQVCSYTIIPKETTLGIHCISLRTGINEKSSVEKSIMQSQFEEQHMIGSNSCRFFTTENSAFQLLKETKDSLFLFATFVYEDSISFTEYKNILTIKMKEYSVNRTKPMRAISFDPGSDHISPSTDRLNQWRDMIIQDAIDEANRKLKCADDVTNIRLHEAVMRLRQCVGFSLGSFLAHSINLTNTAAGRPEHKVEYLLQAKDTYDSASSFGSEMQNISKAGQEWLKVIRDAPDCGDNDGDGDYDSGYPNDDVRIDPSGYVYEGVSSNRVEGVMASCYYKETVEDMYGDLHENVVLWDAEQYAQENPLFTDENGMYRWDVPQGLWQVKFEKEGYETTYSDWLPVPPPQLEVNIGIKQSTQPEVKTARAYEDGIEVEFSKYMQPDLLNTENIFVTKNGETAAGSVKLLNEEQSYEGKAETYASKVRFVPETAFLTTDEVVLTVSRKVKSYAGIPMQEDYTQEFDIEKEVKSLVADSVIKVPYGGTKRMVIGALPYDAAIGKTLIVKSSSSMIATVDVDTLVMDENGQATVTLTGELPGTSVVTFALVDADVNGMSTVQVAILEGKMTANPMASRVSGTAVYRGTEVALSCETEGAVIYYTLDGSCPCDEATQIEYKEPIVITEDSSVIKAMAIAEEMYESDVMEFRYTLKKTTLGLSLKEGWNWISHNVETPIAATELEENTVRIVSQTKELVNDPTYGLIGNLDSISPVEAYKVQVSENTEYTLTGYEYNAAASMVVTAGWNWLGYPVNQVMSVDEALANATPTEGDYIVGQDGFALYSDGVWTGTLLTLNPGSGYMYQAKVGYEFAYNTSIVSKAKALYGKGVANETPWTADKFKYPKVMCVVADLFVDGDVTNEYSVGAFCGTECRGVGKYVDGKLMISVYGNGDEKITFVAMDNETEQTFSVTEEVVFAETLLGSIKQAYPLHIGETTSVLSIFGGWNVRIESDNLYLTADNKAFDRVTLTDVYGNTLLTMENVEPGEPINIATLLDGVYIVTAEQDGIMYYKKIMKTDK